jgi:hypothetical protein
MICSQCVVTTARLAYAFDPVAVVGCHQDSPCNAAYGTSCDATLQRPSCFPQQRATSVCITPGLAHGELVTVSTTKYVCVCWSWLLAAFTTWTPFSSMASTQQMAGP